MPVASGAHQDAMNRVIQLALGICFGIPRSFGLEVGGIENYSKNRLVEIQYSTVRYALKLISTVWPTEAKDRELAMAMNNDRVEASST
jgi:hypothetical protein